MTELAIAQLNIGRTVAPLDDPAMVGFIGRLAEINALAEASPGFLWRLQDEAGNATRIRAFDDPLMIVNLSMWSTIDELYAFAYRTSHLDVLRRRRDWFEPLDTPILVLWWQPAGEPPTLDEAKRRLELLTQHGPTAEAFTFRTRFDPPVAQIATPG